MCWNKNRLQFWWNRKWCHIVERHSRSIIYDHHGDSNMLIELSLVTVQVFLIVVSLTIVIYDCHMFRAQATNGHDWRRVAEQTILYQLYKERPEEILGGGGRHSDHMAFWIFGMKKCLAKMAFWIFGYEKMYSWNGILNFWNEKSMANLAFWIFGVKKCIAKMAFWIFGVKKCLANMAFWIFGILCWKFFFLFF